MNTYQEAFGKHLRYLRRLRSLTQEEVAYRAGVHVTYLSGIERGLRNPSLKNIRAIAGALEVSVGELFAFEAAWLEEQRQASAVLVEAEC